MKKKIRLSLSIKYEDNYSSGKHKFANRLVTSINNNFQSKVEIVGRHELSDAHLTFDGSIKPETKNIYRIDGVWINRADGNLAVKNSAISSGLSQANAVIYQSEFCQLAVNNFLKIHPKKSTIIYNGADPVEFLSKKKYRPARPAFITMCKWRPHKRFNDIAEGFINSNSINHADLHVFGDVEKKIAHPNIIYHGWDRNLNKMLRWCMASVHISYLDWCPNAVIESLVAGVPVIYADSGGTPYIVKEDGFKIRDHSWNYTATDLYGDHRLDISEVARAYDAAYARHLSGPTRFERKDLHIDNVAAQYVRFIDYVLNS